MRAAGRAGSTPNSDVAQVSPFVNFLTSCELIIVMLTLDDAHVEVTRSSDKSKSSSLALRRASARRAKRRGLGHWEFLSLTA